MTSSPLRLTTLSFFTLLVSACGDETGTTASTTVYAAPSATSTDPEITLPAEDNALTPEDPALEPEPTAPSVPTAERSDIEEPDAFKAEADEVGSESNAVTELEWDALIPEGWRPDELFTDDFSDLSDDDPRVLAVMEKLKKVWSEAPVVEALNGKQVKLPGFVVPLDTDAEKTGEFLLVPYYGACIHVPPPPANQTVHVQTEKSREYAGELFDTVWVTGTLNVESSSSDLAEAGYRLQATKVESYE